MNIIRIKYLLLSISICLIMGITSCKDEEPPVQGDTFLELTAYGQQSHQSMHGFGASDAWSCQFIGMNWPEEKKGQLADWLFEKGMDEDQNPKGIGLNIWRFNIGGGSASQGGASGINDPWRRAESFLRSDGSYDWEQQSGQRWFLQAARERGVETFIGFVNSPPVQLTKNSKAYSASASHYNLASQNYQKYADYLAEIVLNLEAIEGITFKYISPFNEPQWDWNSGGQEGTPAQNDEIAAVSRVIDETFTNRNISSLLEIPEAAQFEFLYKDHNRPGRGNQIQAFFDPGSENYLGDLTHVAPKLAAHSYYSTWPLSNFIEVRKQVDLEIKNAAIPVELWMTEYCILENNDEIKGSGRDLGMNAALYTARVIFSDLVLSNASSWQWWLAISPYDYKDGLVFTDKNMNDGNIYDSKTLWAFGNFSRFIAPGMKRLSVGRSDLRQVEQSLEGVMATSFVSEDSLEFTMVIINYSTNPIPLNIALKDLPAYDNLKYYLTNQHQDNNLTNKGSFVMGEIFEMPSRSIMTITNVQ